MEKENNKQKCEHCGKEVDIATSVKIAPFYFIGKKLDLYVCDTKCMNGFLNTFRGRQE